MKKKLICTDRDKATHNASKRVMTCWDADKTSNHRTIAGRVKTVSIKPSEHRTSSKQHKILLSYKKKKEMIHQLFAAGKSTKGQAVIGLPECEKNGNFACTGKH